jgi:7-carboxy-7-deazaguanine synthase
MTLRISEIYQSIQGEGPKVGQPTTFVRFAGCNLKCPGWPCDTPHAIDPRIFTKEQRLLSVEEVLKEIPDYPRNVCFTGGEPLLQNNDELTELAELLREYGVEVFSNGTLAYDVNFLDWVTVVMDWKLPGSREYYVGRDVRLDNLSKLTCSDLNVVKFTIKNRDDFERAVHIWQDCVRPTGLDVYAGIVWNDGTLKTPPQCTNADLVKWILENRLPWKYNVQVHNYIWERTQRGI